VYGKKKKITFLTAVDVRR